MSTNTIDPVTFEVLRHRLWAINDEQAMMAARVSGSPIVYEAYDFNSGLLTAKGEGLLAGVYIIHHAVPMDLFVKQILQRWPAEAISEGDMFFTNDPWSGALHANDGILASPIFVDGEIVAWTALALHDEDVGSPVPGSFVVGAQDRFGEAPLFPPVKLVEGFEIRSDIEASILRNSRSAELNALNMRARLAAITQTHGRIHDLVAQYGKPAFLACQVRLLDYVESVLRNRLSELPDGRFFDNSYVDHDGNEDRLYEVRCEVHKRGDRMTVDFTGTDPQATGPINCTRAGMEGATLGVFLVFLCFDLPWSIGAVRRVVDIVSEEGTVNNAESPAAVSMASVMAAWHTQNAVSNAMAKMLLTSDRYRGEAQACWQPGINGQVIAGTDRTGQPFASLLMDCCGGGAGARSFDDGVDTGGFLQSMSATMPNVETTESRYPVLQVYRRERCDSGGAGRFRGGVSVEYGLMAHKSAGPLAAIVFASGVDQPEAHGIAGGFPASLASNVVVRASGVSAMLSEGRVPRGAAEVPGEPEVLAAKDQTLLAPDDLLISLNVGGGGFGDPLRREPARVLRDVLSGRVSVAAAHDVYGVVITEDVIDQEATASAREAIRRSRIGGADPRTSHSGRSGDRLHTVGDTLDAVEINGTITIQCTACGHELGGYAEDYKEHAALRELAMTDIGPLNLHGHVDEIRVLHYVCPGCGTSIAMDIRRPGDPHLPDSTFVLTGAS